VAQGALAVLLGLRLRGRASSHAPRRLALLEVGRGRGAGLLVVVDDVVGDGDAVVGGAGGFRHRLCIGVLHLGLLLLLLLPLFFVVIVPGLPAVVPRLARRSALGCSLGAAAGAAESRSPTPVGVRSTWLPCTCRVWATIAGFRYIAHRVVNVAEVVAVVAVARS
jgi:hypothetical protein